MELLDRNIIELSRANPAFAPPSRAPRSARPKRYCWWSSPAMTLRRSRPELTALDELMQDLRLPAPS